MSENTKELPTTVRELRHYADKLAHKVCADMQGTPGLDKDGQIQRVQKAIRHNVRQAEALAALLTLVETRDFDARLAEKAAEKAEMYDKFNAIVADDDEDDDDEIGEPVDESAVLDLEDNA